MMQVAEQQRTGPIAQVLSTFEEAHGSDQWAEGKKRRWGWLGAGGLVAGVTLLVVAAIVESGLLGLVGGALVVCGIVSLVVRSTYSKFDLDNRKLATVTQFLKIIQADTPSQRPVRVHVDFRGYLKGGERVVNEKVSTGWLSHIRIKKYVHRWLALSGCLADQTRYQIEVIDRVGRREKPKRKHTKVKERICPTICIGLRFGPERYGAPGAMTAALQQLAPPRGLAVRSIRVQGQGLSIRLAAEPRVRVHHRAGVAIPVPGHEVTGNSLLTALLWAYDGIIRGTRQAA